MTAMSPIVPPRAAYLHVPFCSRRCGYCNFTLVAGRDDLVEPYLAALERELSALESPREVQTRFIGGGTPTRLALEALERLLELTRKWFPMADGGEFSVEANPADVTLPLVDLLASFGVTRISLGAQSLRAEKLRVLERDHGPDDVRRAVELARSRFPSVALDLIFAAPGESLVQWAEDLAGVIALRPDHVSTYGLTIEKGTTFWNRLARGELARLDEETERTMYALAIDTLTAAGLEHYEVSNFARPGHRCRHNEVYWTGGEYYAAGPGAARHVAGRRETNHRSTTTYIRRVLAGQSPVAESETLSPEDRARELFVFAMRRMEGVERSWFAERTGYELDQLLGETIQEFVATGHLTDDGRRVQLTRRGLFVSDALWAEFLGGQLAIQPRPSGRG